MEKLHNFEPMFDRRKSFYGKAQELETENGDKILYSYWTPVLKITADDHLFYTKEATYSITTSRHSREFARRYLKTCIDDYNNTTAQFLEINGRLVEKL